MANSVIATVDHDGARNVLLRVTGILDTSDYAAADITAIANLDPVPTMIRLDRVKYSIEDGLTCLLWWNATSDDLIMPLAGRGKFTFVDWFEGITNPQSTGWTGDVQLSTQGFVSGLKHFTLALEFCKQGV